MPPIPRVRELRSERELTQASLAEAVGIARQSLIAIETGRSIPSVTVALALARALGAPVEALFGGALGPAAAPRLDVELLAPAADGRVALTSIDGRWIAAPLDLGDGRGRPVAADALVVGGARRGPHAVVEPIRDDADLRDGALVIGCAPALGLLVDHLNATRGPGRFTWIARASTAALADLGARRAQIVGVHFGGDDERGAREIAKALPGRDVRVIGLCAWDGGLAIRRDDRLVDALGDDLTGLARRGVRVALRERGAGIQRLFEAAWRRARGTRSPAPTLCAHGHLEAAQAVALGAVDVGLTIASAARRYDLDFVPLARERFDLVVDRRDAEEPRIARLLDALADRRLRQALAAWGDDVGPCGDERAPASAA